jgi:hypothetical protein
MEINNTTELIAVICSGVVCGTVIIFFIWIGYNLIKPHDPDDDFLTED